MPQNQNHSMIKSPDERLPWYGIVDESEALIMTLVSKTKRVIRRPEPTANFRSQDHAVARCG